MGDKISWREIGRFTSLLLVICMHLQYVMDESSSCCWAEISLVLTLLPGLRWRGMFCLFRDLGFYPSRALETSVHLQAYCSIMKFLIFYEYLVHWLTHADITISVCFPYPFGDRVSESQASLGIETCGHLPAWRHFKELVNTTKLEQIVAFPLDLL